MIKPIPTNKRPILMSAGYRTPTPTQHEYVETLECTVKVPTIDPAVFREEPAWEHIYKCTVTGEHRRWGLDDRRVPSWSGDDGSN